jgi:hypothetical protein
MIKAFIQKLLTKPKKVETSKDEVACTVVSGKEPYIGIPAPLVAPYDPWFAPPIKSEKTIMKETEMKIQEAEEKKNQPVTNEPDNIHDLMYNKATKNQNTTVQLNPPGGSENFHEGPGGWNSGTGLNQFR